jgi:hypothetical protein
MTIEKPQNLIRGQIAGTESAERERGCVRSNGLITRLEQLPRYINIRLQTVLMRRNIYEMTQPMIDYTGGDGLERSSHNDKK